MINGKPHPAGFEREMTKTAFSKICRNEFGLVQAEEMGRKQMDTESHTSRLR